MTFNPFNQNVVFLDNDDFTEDHKLVVSHKNPVVIAILADWCPHCVNFKPQLQRFADENSNVNVAVIDSTGNGETQKRLTQRLKNIYPNLRGYPTVLVVKKEGEDMIEYSGKRNSDSLREFINRSD